MESHVPWKIKKRYSIKKSVQFGKLLFEDQRGRRYKGLQSQIFFIILKLFFMLWEDVKV